MTVGEVYEAKTADYNCSASIDWHADVVACGGVPARCLVHTVGMKTVRQCSEEAHVVVGDAVGYEC